MRIRLISFCFFLLMCRCGYSQLIEIKKIDSLISLTSYEEALKLIELHLVNNQDPLYPIAINKKAEIFIAQGKLDQAQSILEKVTESKNLFDEASTLTNLGFLYLNKGRHDLARENLQKAIEKFRQSHNENTSEMARALATLSFVYWSTGKYNQAEENELIALQIRQRLFGEKSEAVAASYNDLGLIYSVSNPDNALEYYEKALAIYVTIHGNDHPKIAIAHTNIGVTYRQLELYGDAINNLETAKRIWEKIYPAGHPNLAIALSTLGKTYRQMKNVKVAQEYYEKALAMLSKYYATRHPDISSVLNELGSLESGNGNYQKAIEDYQQAIVSNAVKFNSVNTHNNPKATDYYNGFVMLHSLRSKAEAFESKYYGKTLKLEDLKVALTTLLTCDSLIDNIRHQSSDENDKLALGDLANEVYEDGVRISHAISEMTTHAKHYTELAFYFAEKSKSAVLQESIADAQAKSFAGIPPELVEQEKLLKSSLTFLLQKLAQKPEPEEEKYLHESIFNLNNEYSDLIKKLETDYPNYFNLKFNTLSASVSDVQRLLGKTNALLSYFSANKDKKVYQFIITKRNFRVNKRSMPSDFDKVIKGFANSLYYSDWPTYHKVTTTLSKLLIPRLPQVVKEITIVPSGRLGTIPFEALLTNGKSMDFSTAKYWVLKKSLSYEFSSSLYVQKSKTKAEPGEANIFLCAPVQFPVRDNLEKLPGTEQEVDQIATLFKGKSSVVKFQDATEAAVKSDDLTKYDYLHFATHGIVDEVNPELSRIFLNTQDQEDGNLYAGEIYNLNLNANLAVLSACQTGLGKFSKGEGVIGLSRAFTYAGAKNIIVSFWSVADESTSQLMTNFYRIQLMNRSISFSNSMRQAKVEMIKDGKYASPYYWAPFILIGN